MIFWVQIIDFYSIVHIKAQKIRKTLFMGVKLHKIPKIGHISKNRQFPLGGEPDLKVVQINWRKLSFLTKQNTDWTFLLSIGVIFHFLLSWPPTHNRHYRPMRIAIRCFRIAQMKEEKICFQMMKNFWGGGGRNRVKFHFEVFGNFLSH